VQRLFLLDGMRGIAALAVVAFHMTPAGSGPFTQAWLAVDFFFLLSGFVMARAYGAKFADMGVSQFMRIRLRRLYPAILAGLALSVVLHVVPGPPDDLLWVKVVLAATMLPYPMSHFFPLNGVQWSLMFELLANALHAAIPAEAARVIPPVLMAVGAGCLVVAYLTGTPLNGGITLDTVGIGIVRTLFSFFAGVTLFHLYERGAFARVARLPMWLVLVPFAVCLVLPTLNLEALRDLLTMVVIWPMLLVLALRVADPSGWVAEACRRLGWLSYPLYAVHMPIFDAMRPLVRAWGWPAIALCCCLIAAAAITVARFTEPQFSRAPRLAPAS
jgi:peptidoglycan/LPS O-acetylase OafA/YrhL